MLFKTLETWVNINSGSGNPEGLGKMADALEEYMQNIPGKRERITLPNQETLDGQHYQPGDVLRLRFRPEAPLKVLFSGHMDTVYTIDHPFQRLQTLANGHLNGPGVADMKGGLLIMIESVRRFLKEDTLGTIGGEIIINGDEEVGSTGSRDLLVEAARQNHLGLVFESALPGGELVRCRKGAGSFRLIAHGRSAHTGRDFENGRNAIVAMSDLMQECHKLNGKIPGIIVNVVNFQAPGPVNVVPDRAEAWLNIRIASADSMPLVKGAIAALVAETEARWNDIRMEISGDFQRGPKEETAASAALHDIWNQTEDQLGLPLSGKRDTGGSSDGNIFAEEGMPHLDGVGIRGGAIHSSDEFAIPESIQPGIDRTVGFLHLLAQQPDCLEAFGRRD